MSKEIMGIIGHVGHGKTTMVINAGLENEKHLLIVDEEKERGISLINNTKEFVMTNPYHNMKHAPPSRRIRRKNERKKAKKK